MYKTDFGKANKHGSEDVGRKSKQKLIPLSNFKSFIDFFFTYEWNKKNFL